MLIPFDQMNETILTAFKGGEGDLCAKMFSDSNGKIMRGRLTPGSHIGLHRQYLHTVQPFQFFLSVQKLLHIPSGQHQIGALLGKGGGNAVADRAAATVAQNCPATAGDDHGFSSKVTHKITSFR